MKYELLIEENIIHYCLNQDVVDLRICRLNAKAGAANLKSFN
jgi:hypothetical protein